MILLKDPLLIHTSTIQQYIVQTEAKNSGNDCLGEPTIFTSVINMHSYTVTQILM